MAVFELNFLLSLYTVLVNKLGISIMGVVLETIAEKKKFQEPYQIVLFHIKSLEFSFNKQFSALSASFRGATNAEGANSGDWFQTAARLYNNNSLITTQSTSELLERTK